MSLSPQWHEVTALFGGTFDPPHVGHRIAVKGLFEVPRVKRVIVMPAATPPLKSRTGAASEQRIAMSRICFSPSATDPFYPMEVEISPLEIDRAAKNPAMPSYTFDTLIALRRSLPDLAFVLGTDQLASFEKWHRFPEILGLCHWIVLERKPVLKLDARATLSQFQGSGLLQTAGDGLWRTKKDSSGAGGTFLQVVPTEAPELSSTIIRETLAKTGLPPDRSLTPEVLSYLKQNALYGTAKP